MINEFVFKLSQPLTHARDGMSTQSEELVIQAPNAKIFSEIAELKKDVIRNFMSNDTKDRADNPAPTQGEAKAFTANEIIVFLYSRESFNMKKCLEMFKKILAVSCLIAPVNQGTRVYLLPSLFDEISFTDLENIFGEYLINFLLFSILSKSI